MAIQALLLWPVWEGEHVDNNLSQTYVGQSMLGHRNLNCFEVADKLKMKGLQLDCFVISEGSELSSIIIYLFIYLFIHLFFAEVYVPRRQQAIPWTNEDQLWCMQLHYWPLNSYANIFDSNNFLKISISILFIGK